MLNRFEDFVTGITECHRYIQRIKAMEMTEFGLKGTHVIAFFIWGAARRGSPPPGFAPSAARIKPPYPALWQSWSSWVTAPVTTKNTVRP